MPAFLDDTDNVMTHLAHKKINAFSGIGHGFYFWNFRYVEYYKIWRTKHNKDGCHFLFSLTLVVFHDLSQPGSPLQL